MPLKNRAEVDAAAKAVAVRFAEILKLARGGDRVRYLAYDGRGSKGPEYKPKVGKVNPLLIFPGHLVINIGGRFGTPAVVDERNFLALIRDGKEMRP